MVENNDIEIINLCINGDDSAFSSIVDRYLSAVLNFTYRLCGSREDAEEITQETFLKVWKNLRKFKQTENFKTWLYTIARNTTIDKLRKRKDVLFSAFDSDDGGNFLEDTLPDNELLPDKIFEKEENARMVVGMFENLPVIYKEVLQLYYVEEMTLVEISKILNKSVDTVKSQHRRALIQLRKMLEMRNK